MDTSRRPTRAQRSAGPMALVAAVDRLLADAGAPAEVLDLGGGTGGLAVHLALAGHRVTVVDPSPDALAALTRRAAEAGAGDRVRAVQGDAEGLVGLLAPGSADLVLCHGVLEVVDDPQVALQQVREVLRAGGRLSLLVAQRQAAVLSRVGAGHLRQALHLAQDPAGRWGPDDPLLRRFDLPAVHELLAAAGFTVTGVEGVRAFADLVPRGQVDTDPDTAELLAGLEAHAASSGTFLQICAQLHLHAVPA